MIPRMEVAVLVAGVADPKWPLPADLSSAALQAHEVRHAALSPFDEAALELALALRDRDPQVRVTAIVAADEGLARKVAGWRPDALHRALLDEVPRWDAQALGAVLAQALAALAPAADLVLVGREFGDWDDGSAVATLAQRAGLPHVSLGLGVAADGEALHATRQGDGGPERVRLPGRTLLSVTNDRGNRLRHPLMKNVMAARKAPIGSWRPPPPAGAVSLQALQAAAVPERTVACEWIAGTPQEQAEALARLLLAEARG